MNYRELAIKIRKALRKNRKRLKHERHNELSVIEFAITHYFKPDGDLVERARQWRENLSGTIEGESLLTYANIDKMLASFHLQETYCQSGQTSPYYWQGYNQAIEDSKKSTPIDDKGIYNRAKAFYECNAGKCVTQPAGTWDMLADFAISELSRLPQGKEDAENP